MKPTTTVNPGSGRKYYNPASRLAAHVVLDVPYDARSEHTVAEIAFARESVGRHRALGYPDERIEFAIWAWAKDGKSMAKHVTRPYKVSQSRALIATKPKTSPDFVLDLHPMHLNEDGDLDLARIQALCDSVRPKRVHLRHGTVVLHSIDLTWGAPEHPLTITRTKAHRRD